MNNIYQTVIVFAFLLGFVFFVVLPILDDEDDPEIKFTGYVGYNYTVISNTTKSGQVISVEKTDDVTVAKIISGNQNWLTGNDEYVEAKIENKHNIPITGKYVEFEKIRTEAQNCRHTTEYKNGTVIMLEDVDDSLMIASVCSDKLVYNVKHVINGVDMND